MRVLLFLLALARLWIATEAWIHALQQPRQQRGASSARCNLASSGDLPESPPDLFLAIATNDVEQVKRFFDVTKFKGDAADILGEPALLSAAKQGGREIVQILVEVGKADANVASFNGGETPLMGAARKGHVDIVRYLVEKAGAYIDAMDNRGDTALHAACYWGQFGAAEYLVGAGADLQIRNDEGKRPGEDFETFVSDGTEEERRIARLLLDNRGEDPPEKPIGFI